MFVSFRGLDVACGLQETAQLSEVTNKAMQVHGKENQMGNSDLFLFFYGKQIGVYFLLDRALAINWSTACSANDRGPEGEWPPRPWSWESGRPPGWRGRRSPSDGGREPGPLSEPPSPAALGPLGGEMVGRRDQHQEDGDNGKGLQKCTPGRSLTLEEKICCKLNLQ